MKRAARLSAQPLKYNFANNDMSLTLFALGCIISNGGAEESKIWEESRICFLQVQHGKMVLLKKKEAGGIICSFVACPWNSHSDLFLKDCLAALAWMDLSCVEQKHPGLTLQLINKPWSWREKTWLYEIRRLTGWYWSGKTDQTPSNYTLRSLFSVWTDKGV